MNNFSTVKNNCSSRFTEIQIFLNHVTVQEPNSAQETVPSEVKIMRGLFYVHLYSVIENTVNETIQRVLMLINSKNVKNIHFTSKFNAVSSTHKLKSLKDSSYNNFIKKSTELFDFVKSSEIRIIDETTLSKYLQNIWFKSVEEILNVFGIQIPNFSTQTKVTINEIVDKRNAVAHGRETAKVIGESHNCSTLLSKLQICNNFLIDFIDEFDSYIENMKYLKPNMKKYY